MCAVEAVGDAQHPCEPLDKRTVTAIQGGEASVPRCVRKSLTMITGNERTDKPILLIEPGDVEFLNQVATVLVVFS